MNILVVEDEILMANALKSQLVELAYENVHIVSNSEGALECYGQFAPDLVIMDIGLKNSQYDGIELAKQLLEKETVPIIFLSSYSDENTLSRVRDLTYANYLIKPCSTRQLFVSINSAIENYIRANKDLGVVNQASSYTLFTRKNHFFVKGKSNSYSRVDVNEILWIQAVRGGIEFNLTQGRKEMLTASMNSFMNQFYHPDIVRIHRSYTVNKTKVSSIQAKNLCIKDREISKTIPFGKNYLQEVKSEFLILKSN